MPTTSIDKILQIAVSSRTNADSSKATPADDARFQEHLQRASTTDKPSSSPELKNKEPLDEEGLEIPLDAGQEQENSLEQNEVAPLLNENQEPAEQLLEEIESILEADDITLSTAAVVAAEAIVAVASNSIADDLTEVEPTAIIPSDATGDSSSENAEPTPLKIDPTANASAAPYSEDGIVEAVEEPVIASDEGQNKIAEATEGTDRLANPKPIDKAPIVDDTQQQPQEAQPTNNSEPAEQGIVNPHPQPKKGQGGLQQSSSPEEVESSETKDDSAVKVETNVSNESSDQFKSLDRENLTANTNGETEASDTATAAEVKISASSESAFTPDRLSSASPLDQTTTASEARTEEADSAPTVDRSRFIQRVSGAIRAAKDQDGLMQLKLSPPELGTLRIEITVKQGVLTAQLETETAAARNLLLDNLPALRERLAEQDIRIEKFDVDVRDEGGHQQENPGAEDRHTSNTRSEKMASRVTTDGNKLESSPIPLDINGNSADLSAGLDVMI